MNLLPCLSLGILYTTFANTFNSILAICAIHPFNAIRTFNAMAAIPPMLTFKGLHDRPYWDLNALAAVGSTKRSPSGTGIDPDRLHIQKSAVNWGHGPWKSDSYCFLFTRTATSRHTGRGISERPMTDRDWERYLGTARRGTRALEFVPLGYAKMEVTERGQVLITDMYRWMCEAGYMVYAIEALRTLIPEPFTLKVHAAFGTDRAYTRMGFVTDPTDKAYSHVMVMDWRRYKCAVEPSIPVTNYVTNLQYDSGRYTVV